MEADPTLDEPEWAIEIIQFLRNGLLLEDKVAARRVKIQATRFRLLCEVLYKRGYSEPLLKCLSKTEANYVLREIHEGVCARRPLRRKDAGAKNHPSRLLLAYDQKGFGSSRQNL
jgi:hypothetical protein